MTNQPTTDQEIYNWAFEIVRCFAYDGCIYNTSFETPVGRFTCIKTPTKLNANEWKFTHKINGFTDFVLVNLNGKKNK